MESQIKTTVEITKYKYSGSSESFERVKTELEQSGFNYIEYKTEYSSLDVLFDVVVLEKIEPLK